PPVDPALDLPDCAITDGRSLLIGESRRADEDECLTLIGGKFRKRRPKLLKLHTTVLLRVGLQALRVTAVGVFDLTPTLAIFRPEQIPENREQPCRHVRPG